MVPDDQFFEMGTIDSMREYIEKKNQQIADKEIQKKAVAQDDIGLDNLIEEENSHKKLKNNYEKESSLNIQIDPK